MAKAAAAPAAELIGPLEVLKEKFGEAVLPPDYQGAHIKND